MLVYLFIDEVLDSAAEVCTLPTLPRGTFTSFPELDETRRSLADVQLAISTAELAYIFLRKLGEFKL